LTTLYLTGAKNTGHWHAWKGDLQRAFPLDVMMVPSSVFVTAAGGKHLSRDGFSLGETICFGNLDFINDQFDGLSLSPLGDGSGAIIMGPTHGGPLLLQWTMMGDPTEGFPMAPNGEVRTDLPFSGRQRGCSSHFNHNHTAPRELSGQSSYNDHSAMAGDTMIERQGPPRAMVRLSGGRTMME
jgi:hypothetical protein